MNALIHFKDKSSFSIKRGFQLGSVACLSMSLVVKIQFKILSPQNNLPYFRYKKSGESYFVA